MTRYPRRRARRVGPLPRGAGRVNCTLCGATAAADGKGTPIVLRHESDCPEGKG
jgi:LSD1 subclass zinc finger protein